MQVQVRPNPNMEREMKMKSLRYKELLVLISAQRGESALFNNVALWASQLWSSGRQHIQEYIDSIY